MTDDNKPSGLFVMTCSSLFFFCRISCQSAPNIYKHVFRFLFNQNNKKTGFPAGFRVNFFERVTIQVLQGGQGYCHVCEEKQKQPDELKNLCAEELSDLSSADEVKYKIVF